MTDDRNAPTGLLPQSVREQLMRASQVDCSRDEMARAIMEPIVKHHGFTEADLLAMTKQLMETCV